MGKGGTTMLGFLPQLEKAIKAMQMDASGLTR